MGNDRTAEHPVKVVKEPEGKRYPSQNSRYKGSKSCMRPYKIDRKGYAQIPGHAEGQPLWQEYFLPEVQKIVCETHACHKKQRCCEDFVISSARDPFPAQGIRLFGFLLFNQRAPNCLFKAPQLERDYFLYRVVFYSRVMHQAVH